MLFIALFIVQIVWFVKVLIRKPAGIMDIWTHFELNSEGVTFSAEDVAEKKIYFMNQISNIYPYISEKNPSHQPRCSN